MPAQILAQLLEKPLRVAAAVATKVEKVAAATAAKAAKVSSSIQARIAEAARARALIAARPKPGIHFVRDLRRGEMRFSFYRSVDRRGGVREFWTLNRKTKDGLRRLATGTMEEFRDMRAMSLRSLYETQGRGQAQGQKVGEQTREGPSQAQARTGRDTPEPNRKQLKATNEEPRETWYSLVYVQGSLARGDVQARVVRNFTDPKKAMAAARNNPKFAVYRLGAQQPRRQGTLVTSNAANFDRPQQQRQASRPPNRVNAPAHVNGQWQENKRRLQQSR